MSAKIRLKNEISKHLSKNLHISGLFHSTHPSLFYNSPILDKKIGIQTAFSAAGFFHLQKLEVFFSFERCSTAMPCAGRTWMQQGMLVFTEAFMSFQLPVLRTYAFQKAFFSYNNVINVKAPGQPIFTLIGHHLRHPFFFDSASKPS